MTSERDSTTGVSCRGGTRKMTSPSCARLCVGDTIDALLTCTTYFSIPKSASVKKISPAYMMPTKRALFDIDESASIAQRRQDHLQERIDRNRREQEQRSSATKAKLPANMICMNSSSSAGTQVPPAGRRPAWRPCRPRTRSASAASTGRSAARWRGGRCDQPRAHVDRDEEHEELLLFEELAEGLRRGREQRDLREVGRR